MTESGFAATALSRQFAATKPASLISLYLFTLGFCYAVVTTLFLGETSLMQTNKPVSQKYSVLTQDEAEILELVADRIFPKTTTAGAVEIGAIQYIDLALAGDYAPLVPLYRQGIRALERHSRGKFGRAFGSLSGELKDTVLLAFEAGAVAEFKNAADFFETVRCHVLEGVFCEPHYGGNKDMLGWRLVGFPGQQFGYADAYINRRVDLDAVAVESPSSEEKKS
jgi:gluconate 2-dehydrogenase subunit 3-like protein